MKKDLILQVNIPFCTSRCAHCAESICAYSAGTSAAYTRALLREIEALKEDLAEYEIRAVSLEGGCPTLLEPGNLQLLLRALRRSFPLSDDVQISLQTMPGDYSRALMDRMRDGGVNFYTVGLCTANLREHEILERPYRFDALTMVDTAIRTFHPRALSFDLLYGIPGQTWESLKHSLETALFYDCGHLSLLPLRIAPGTRLALRVLSGELAEMQEEEKKELHSRADELLKSHGLRPNTRYDYARPGGENRFREHFLKGTEQLGLGLHSLTILDGMSWRTGRSLPDYLEHAGDLSAVATDVTELSGEALKALTQLRERMRPA